MAAQNPGTRRRHGVVLLLGVLLGVLPAPGPVRGQAAPAREYFSPIREFKIPFTAPADPQVQHVFLHVSSDNGASWQHTATANPGDRAFQFQAPKDGWYWFTTQTQDRAGNLAPVADSRQFTPLIKVCVDTVKPVVTLRQVAPHDGTVAVEWDVQDDNLDVMTLHIDYRPLGSHDVREWLPLHIPAIPHGEKGWTPPLNIPLEVHLGVRDKAGNVAEQTISVTPGRAAPGTTAPGPPLVRHVKGREFQLRCKITNEGDSGVQGIDVYVLRDNVWQKFSADPKQYKKEPDGSVKVAVKVAGPGRWGFTLIPRSGVGLSNPPPRLGDPPQIWIEVDETRPDVRIDKVDVGQGPDLGRMTVYWTASDVHLRTKPITISYSATKDGPWTPLASQLDNTRVHVVDTHTVNPKLPFEFYLKVEAVDEAGNVGSAVTPNTVKIDTKIPIPKEVDVDTPGELPPRPGGDPPMTPGGM